MKQVVMALMFALAPTLAQSATYYVAKTGSDNYSCSQAQSASTPKLTLTGASGGLKCLRAGDTLTIKSGTYAEFINYNQIPSGSSWDAATVVRAAAGETVILQPTSGGRGGDAVWFWGQSYIVLDGLIIDAVNVSVQGVRINDNNGSPSHHIRLQNVEVKNARQGNCIGVQTAGEHDLQFLNVKVHNCGASTQFHHGIYLRGSNHVVDHAEVYNIAGYGIQIYSSAGGANNNTVRNSILHDNGSYGLLLGSGKSNVAYNNQVYNNSRTSFGGGIYVTTGANNQVYNNTIYSNNGYCVRAGSGSTGTLIQNNLCWANSYNSIQNLGLSSIILDNSTTTKP